MARWPGLLAAALALTLATGARPDEAPKPLAEPPPSAIHLGPQIIAVLPFMHAEAPRGYLAHGVAETIIRRLVQDPRMIVLSRDAIAAAGRRVRPLDAYGRRIGARHVLAGALRHAGDRQELSVQLVDAETRRMIWQKRYAGPKTEAERLHNAIADDIARAIADGQTRRPDIAPIEPTTPAAYDLLLQARQFQATRGRYANTSARELFTRTIEAVPTLGPAYAGRAETRLRALRNGWAVDAASAEASFMTDARRAAKFAPKNGRALGLLATAHGRAGDHGTALQAAEAAVRLAPSDAIANAALGRALIFADRPADAAKALARAMTVDPRAPRETISDLALAHLLADQPGRAVATLDKNFARLGDSAAPWAILAAAYLGLGEDGRARQAAEAVRRLYPDFNGAQFAATIAPPQAAARLAATLREAGF